MSLARAQVRWEESRLHGPSDDPDDRFIEAIQEQPLISLAKALTQTLATLRCPEPGDDRDRLRRQADALRAEIQERLTEKACIRAASR